MNETFNERYTDVQLFHPLAIMALDEKYVPI